MNCCLVLSMPESAVSTLIEEKLVDSKIPYQPYNSGRDFWERAARTGYTGRVVVVRGECQPFRSDEDCARVLISTSEYVATYGYHAHITVDVSTFKPQCICEIKAAYVAVLSAVLSVLRSS